MKLIYTVQKLVYSAKSIADFLCMNHELGGSHFAEQDLSILTLYAELKRKNQTFIPNGNGGLHTKPTPV